MLQPAPQPPATAATPPSAATPPEALVWPNPESFTNSDPWLPEHHDRIMRLEPRVLVVNFDETKHGDAALAFARTVSGAFAEASRYHGYRDAMAPVFLNYQFVHVADLPDARTSRATPSLRLIGEKGSVRGDAGRHQDEPAGHSGFGRTE